MNRHLPLVSVIIPCYNHELYIEQALNSVTDDSYSNKEIVIIDDGSKDKSDELIKAWIGLNSQRITVKYSSRENRGVCKTLNELIKLASGKYILLLASDDALYGDTITERVKILEEKEPEGKMVLVSDALVVNEHNEIIMDSSMADYCRGNKVKYNTDDGILEEVILNPSISGAVVLINKKIYDEIGLYPEDMNTEDWFFYQRAASLKAILFLDKKVSFYRLHSSNTSRAFDNIQVKLINSIIKTLFINLRWFPSLKYKLFGIKQILRYSFVLLKVRIKNLFK